MSTMKNHLLCIILLLLTIISASHAQDDGDVSTTTSAIPTSMAISSMPSSSQQTQAPSTTPVTGSEPSTMRPSMPSSDAPIFTQSPTDSRCANTPGWRYEYWEYAGYSCSNNRSYKKLLRLSCDDDRVECWEYGNLGSALFNCCKCNEQCSGQCNNPATTAPTPVFDDDCNYGYNTNDYYDYDDYYDNEDDDSVAIFTGIAIFICFCLVGALWCCNHQNQQTASLEANRQRMAARRREQTGTNGLGLTDEERNHARYELFVTKFHFQTVLPDKSNISAESVRTSATKPDEEHPNDDNITNDDASAIGGGGGTSEGSLRRSVSRRLSSWRHPSARDECCICLERYNVGETICAPITTECNHVFHEACVLQWFKNNDKCPLCRVELLKVRRSDDDVHA